MTDALPIDMTPAQARALLDNDPDLRGVHYCAISVLEEAATLAERERCAVIAEIAATHALGEPCRVIAKRIRIDPAKGE